MALVKGPLFSIEARGKIADAMVHFPWKGRAVVRKWLKPANPRDVDQQIIRQKMAGCGKNTARISVPSATLADGSKMYALVKAETPANNIWNAYLTKTILDEMKTDGNFTELSTDLQGTDATQYWIAAASELLFDTLTGDQFATAISPELQLIMGAWCAFKLQLSDDTHIYSTYPTTWLSDVVSQFATNYTHGG